MPRPVMTSPQRNIVIGRRASREAPATAAEASFGVESNKTNRVQSARNRRRLIIVRTPGVARNE